LTIEELTRHAKEFLRKNYDMDLTVPITINPRLKSSLGRFVFSKSPNEIQIAGYVIKYADKSVILDTLFHECVHYALYMQGKPFNDGDELFELELRRLGVSSTETNRVGLYVVLACEHCGETFETHNLSVKKYPGAYITSCCRAPIKVIGEKIYNGTEAV
jgi:SprT-like protein